MLCVCSGTGGNIGSFLAGLSTVIIAIAALKQGPAVVRAWIDRTRAQAEEVREEAETIRLERHRHLSGWSADGVWTYEVTLVTAKDELEQAARELSGGEATAYVVLRATQGGSGDVNAAASLRHLVEQAATSPGRRPLARSRHCARALMRWAFPALGTYPVRLACRCGGYSYP